MKKRIFAGLLTLVMVFTLLPVSAMATNEAFILGTTTLGDASLEKGTQQNYKNGHAINGGTASKRVGESGLWQRLPRYSFIYPNAQIDYTPVNYAIPADGVQVSKEGVIGDCQFTLVHSSFSGYTNVPALQFNYTAKKTGTTNVTLTYFYNYGLMKTDGQPFDTNWYKDTVTFTISVGDGEIQPPSKPTVDDIKRFRNYVNATSSSKGAVYMWCDAYDHHAWFDHITDVPGAYTLGDVVANDGSVLPKATYPWVCAMTLNASEYLAAYNEELGGKYGTHYLKAGQSATETVTWYWNAKLSKWQYRTSEAHVYIDITHDAPVTPPTPDKPVPPSYDDLKSVIGKIQVKDVSKPDCGTESYDLIDNTQSELFNWTKTARQDQPGTYDVSIKTAPYVAKYNSEKAKAHELNDAGQTTLNLVISYKDKKWDLDDGKAEIEVKHTESTPTETPLKAPTADELKKLEMAVQVKCVVDDSQQHKDAYDLLGKCDADYFVGELRKDGDNWQLKTQGRVHVTEEYTVTFNAYGGFPTPDEQHVKSGEKAVLPVAPTLKGYTFAFWYLGEDEQKATAYDFDTPVTGDITLTAKWNINKYTVTFDSYGGTPVPPKQEVEYGLTAAKPDDPTLKGHTFAFWYLGEDEQNATAYNFDTPVTENITLTAKWNINKYTVTFDTDGGTPVPPNQEVEYGLTATEPTTAPTKTGYTFDGWYLGDEKYGFSDAVEQNITLKAKWEAIPYGVTYSYHNSVPAEVMDTLPTDKGTYTVKDQVPVQIPTAKEVAVDGYKWTFKGWQLDGKDVKSEQVNMTVGGLHFEGIWEREALPAAEYPVTYEYVSGTEGADLPWNVFVPVNKYTYAEGEKVTTAMKPDDVVFGEYTWKFQGWTLDGTAVAPNTQVPMAKGGLHFVGTWIRTSAQDEEYPVTYSYVSGVEGVELPEEVKATLPVNKDTYTIGQQVPTAAKPANVTVGDYIWSLKAWKLGDNEIVPNNSVPMVEGGLNFVGIWTREKATVTVTFDANGGTVAPTSKTITKGSTLTLPTPVLSGYSFDGWFTEKTGGTQVNAGATFDKDTTLYAHWTKKSSSGGGGSSSRDYDYTLRYVTNGGKSIASETKSKRWTKDYEDLPMPTRAGYRFDGWYYDSALKNEVTGDVKVNSRTVTLYAGWIGSSVPDSLNGEDHFAYVQGYADGTVRPNTPVTRAQVATILFRLLDESVRKEYLTENNTFTDVASNYWANTAISTMANMGVFKGRTADRFDPNAPITRGEFAAVCARFDDSKVKTTETYSDIDGYWAANEILRAAALGWVQGYQDGSYRPNNSITRAQVVTMINRVLCRMPEKNADLLKGMSSFTDCAEDDWCYLAIQEATNSHDYKTKSGSIHEKWTDLNTAPDWSRFEH